MNVIKAGNQILKKHSDYDIDLLKILRRVPTTILGDSMHRMQGVDADIYSMNNVKFVGVAFTVRVPEGDNLFIHEALEMIDKHDVLVVSSIGKCKRALIGELMIRTAQMKDVSGIVVDGYIRDLQFIQSLKTLGVYARGTSLNGPFKNGPGEINVPVAIGCQVICPGDYICADENGIVVIPQNEIRAVIDKSIEIMNEEEKIKSQISQGIYRKEWKEKKILGINPFLKNHKRK